VLVHLFKSVTIANIFLYWKIDLLCIFNIIKNMMHEFIKDIQNNNIKSQSLDVLFARLIGLGILCLRIQVLTI